MKIISIVGARPEFIQAKPVSEALRLSHQEILVHTGQHYDYAMSQSFFDALEIPSPDYNLEVGSGSQAIQTAEILIKLEQVIIKENPHIVILRGDTNSTLAGSLAASKLQIPVAHIEAGERSYNRSMPEEINRIVTDSIANFHLCASNSAVGQLKREGIEKSVFFVGDVMLDVMNFALPIARDKSNILERLELEPQKYSVVTIHRAGNTNDPSRLLEITSILNLVNETVVFPVHPRTQKALKKVNAIFKNHIRVIEPLGYLDMIRLEENARIIATDSGGVQREAYFQSVPCLTMREETEWTETVQAGWNQLVGIDQEKILSNWFDFTPPTEHPPIFGVGKAGKGIVKILERELNSTN